MIQASQRGTTTCRGCGQESLSSVLDLGNQPLSNELVIDPTIEPEAFPLHFRICTECGLGQVGEFVLPERIFGRDYPYLSSTSTSWVQHARNYATDMTDRLGLAHGELVVEIASNDGYLLKGFLAAGQRVLGIEPAQNVAEMARAAGVSTISEFWGAEVAARVLAENGHPRLIAANNVMAHVPDLHDFVSGLALMCGPETLITVENPSMMNMLHEAQFDTIYHEHFCYLTASAVRFVAAQHGLDLVDVQELSTHGGSNRYHLRRAGVTTPAKSVASLIEHERAQGLFDADVWARFTADSRASIAAVSDWLDERTRRGNSVAGYGAAAKGNTLLNAVGDPARHISYVVDGSVAKQGKFLPGPQIRVLAPSYLTEAPADEVLILPWNLAAELTPIIRSLSPTSRIWVPRPRVEQVG
ncbi:MAG: methyltransferase domain-containing protein [Marmoricola sp.]